MGMFDYVYVCPNCKKINISGNATCPTCAVIMKMVNNSPKKWASMEETEKQKAIRNVLAWVDDEEAVKAEKEKEENEKIIEEIETDSLITTTNRFENAEIERYLGVVSGTAIYLVGGIVGGGLVNQENLFGAAFAQAKCRMLDKAKKRGANAVVGMSITVTSPGNLNNIIVIVTGTAVKLREEE